MTCYSRYLHNLPHCAALVENGDVINDAGCVSENGYAKYYNYCATLAERHDAIVTQSDVLLKAASQFTTLRCPLLKTVTQY